MTAAAGPWSVAVFTSREGVDTLARTVAAVVAACGARPATIDVLVDGNAATATALAASPPTVGPATTVRLWSLPWRDKACAWNRYVHELMPAAATTFFVDGYVRPRPASFAALAQALDERADAWAASALPSAGRSAPALRARMTAEGGIHGNLYALRGAALDTLRGNGFHLPLGLYRNDSLLGAAIAFGADPARETWTASRIVAVGAATWDTDPPRAGWRRVADVVGRRLRQAQGDLENAAVRDHLAVRHEALAALPRTVQGLLAAGAPPSGHGALARVLQRRARRRLAAPVDWSRCDAAPELLRTWAAT